jgi:hypothetical protein
MLTSITFCEESFTYNKRTYSTVLYFELADKQKYCTVQYVYIQYVQYVPFYITVRTSNVQ